MPLKSAVVTHIVWSRTSLWSGTRLSSGFIPAYRLLMRVVQHPFVIHIPLFLHLELLSSSTNFNLLFSLYKLHFFAYESREIIGWPDYPFLSCSAPAVMRLELATCPSREWVTRTPCIIEKWLFTFLMYPTINTLIPIKCRELLEIILKEKP